MTFLLARRAFLTVLSLCYLSAFSSLAFQIRGLVGADGIQPARLFLDTVARQHGIERFWWVPTLCWIDVSDGVLVGLCLGGAGLALLLAFGIAPALVLALLWGAYLSLQGVGGVFLHFQWDALLLEAGFLAILLAPGGLRPGNGELRPPSRLTVFLFHLLLFRLMVSSGAVKLLSGDITWWGLSALPVHYETQPLPTWIGWWAFQLPEVVHRVSVGATLAIELIVPWAIWLGPRFRRLAFVPLAGLQVVIFLTGNYGFFNLLTFGLCLWLLDDHTWPPGWRPAPGATGRPWPVFALGPVVALVLFGTAIQVTSLVGAQGIWSPDLRRAGQLVRALGIVSGYGLFAVTTTERSEIVIEGSNDGKEWRAFELPWKPGDPSARPRIIAPHMPRLDWQLWFAALGDARGNPWFLALVFRLLEGSRPVRDLFVNDPFPDTPPRLVRARIEDYRFTTVGEREWWRRSRDRTYLSPVTLPGAPRSGSISRRSSAKTKDRSAARKSSAESSPGATHESD